MASGGQVQSYKFYEMGAVTSHVFTSFVLDGSERSRTMADAVILSWEMQALHNARLDHIYKLARLLEQNLLTEEEFAQEKRKLLSSTMPPDLMNGGNAESGGGPAAQLLGPESPVHSTQSPTYSPEPPSPPYPSGPAPSTWYEEPSTPEAGSSPARKPPKPPVPIQDRPPWHGPLDTAASAAYAATERSTLPMTLPTAVAQNMRALCDASTKRDNGVYASLPMPAAACTAPVASPSPSPFSPPPIDYSPLFSSRPAPRSTSTPGQRPGGSPASRSPDIATTMRATPSSARSKSAERPRSAPVSPLGSPMSPTTFARRKGARHADMVTYGTVARSGAAFRKAEGQLRLDAHVAAQDLQKQLNRAESVLPLAKSTGVECQGAWNVARRALDANPLLHGGVVPDTKAVAGRTVPTHRPTSTEEGRVVSMRRPTAIQDRLREELRHALRHLAQTAQDGGHSMDRRVETLEACIGALRNCISQLTGCGPTQSPRSRTDFGRLSREVGRLSPGTLAPQHLASSSPSASQAGSMDAPRTDGAASTETAGTEEVDGEADWTRSIWMYDSAAGDDVRGDILYLVGAAGQLSRAAQNLVGYTRDQVRFVRAGLVMYRDKIQEAQRKIAASSVRQRDHLHSPRRGTRSPPHSARAGQSHEQRSPVDVGQDVNTGTSRWPPKSQRHRHKVSV